MTPSIPTERVAPLCPFAFAFDCPCGGFTGRCVVHDDDWFAAAVERSEP